MLYTQLILKNYFYRHGCVKTTLKNLHENLPYTTEFRPYVFNTVHLLKSQKW